MSLNYAKLFNNHKKRENKEKKMEEKILLLKKENKNLNKIIEKSENYVLGISLIEDDLNSSQFVDDLNFDFLFKDLNKTFLNLNKIKNEVESLYNLIDVKKNENFFYEIFYSIFKQFNLGENEIFFILGKNKI